MSQRFPRVQKCTVSTILATLLAQPLTHTQSLLLFLSYSPVYPAFILHSCSFDLLFPLPTLIFPPPLCLCFSFSHTQMHTLFSSSLGIQQQLWWAPSLTEPVDPFTWLISLEVLLKIIIFSLATQRQSADRYRPGWLEAGCLAVGKVSISLYSHSAPRASQWRSGGSEGWFCFEWDKKGKQEKKQSWDHNEATEWESTAGAVPPRNRDSEEAAVTVQQRWSRQRDLRWEFPQISYCLFFSHGFIETICFWTYVYVRETVYNCVSLWPILLNLRCSTAGILCRMCSLSRSLVIFLSHSHTCIRHQLCGTTCWTDNQVYT